MVSETEKKLQWSICRAEVVRMISKGEDWSRAYHSQNFKTGHFLNHVVNFNGNPPRRDDFFQQELRWGCESRMWSWMRILWSHVITRINLEKFCHDFIEKLITTTNTLGDCTTNTLDDSVLEINLGTKQGVRFLASKLFLLKLSIQWYRYSITSFV